MHHQCKVEPLTMEKCEANASRCGEYVQLAEESLDINQSEADASISQLQLKLVQILCFLEPVHCIL